MGRPALVVLGLRLGEVLVVAGQGLRWVMLVMLLVAVVRRVVVARGMAATMPVFQILERRIAALVGALLTAALLMVLVVTRPLLMVVWTVATLHTGMVMVTSVVGLLAEVVRAVVRLVVAIDLLLLMPAPAHAILSAERP